MKSLFKFDFIKIGESKFFVSNISRKEIDLMPIDLMLTEGGAIDTVPIIKVNKSILKYYEHLDNDYFFYLLNQKDKRLVQAIENFLDNETD